MRKIAKLNHAFLYCCLVALFCMPPKLFLTAQSAPPVGKAITLIVKNSSLADILRQVSKKSELMIYFQDTDLAEFNNVSINVKNKPVESILHELLDGRGFTWVEVNKSTIAIKKKEGQGNKERIFSPLDSTISVMGKVVKENGDPIPGATILIKNTKLGTVTSADGSFRVPGVKSDASIVITNIGYLTREILIKGKSNIGTIQLGEFVGILDETVVLAYTKTTNRFLTGNVGGIKRKDIENSPVSNPILAVAGRVPGVMINQTRGFASSGVSVVVQGVNSLQKGITPFYVVDGIPYTQSLLPNLGDILGSSGSDEGNGPVNGSPLAYLNPNDIESIEVLKDADATAIYGSRAANGAIIITTKKGKAGKLKIGVNVQYGVGQVPRKLDLLNTKQYLEMRREAKFNDNANVRASDYDINGTWDSTKYTDWQKVLIGNKAHYRDVQLNFSGGTNTIRYIVNGGYHKETTVFPTSLSDRKASLSFNIEANSENKKLQVSVSGSYLHDDNRLPVADLTNYAMILAPNMPNLKKPDGELNWATTSNGVSSISPHPLAALNQTYKNSTTNVISNVVLNYRITNSLAVKTNLGFTSLITNENSKFPSSVVTPERRPIFTRTSDFGFNKITSWIVEPQVIYNPQIRNSELNIIAGTSFQETSKDRKLIKASGFDNDQSLDNIAAATSTTILPNSAILSNYKYNGIFLQINYNLNKTYFINISGRRDGSSRFGEKNRFHNFGALGLGWIFTNERFLKNGLRFLSFGKIRGSFGTTGNDQIGDYNYLALYNSANSQIPYRSSSSLEVTRINNPYLQWEETKKLSVGLDLGFVEDRFLLNTVYYRNRSSNMLVTSTIPSTAGPVSGLVINLPAVIQNDGFEISFSSNNIKKINFSWTTSINFTVPKNKLIEFEDLENSVYKNFYIIGEAANIIKTFSANGVNPVTGKYEFLDKEGKVTDNPQDDLANNVKNINPNPKYYGGLSNTISVRGFTLDFLLQYVKQVGQNLPYGSAPGMNRSNQTQAVLNRWQKEGDHASVQRYTTNDFDYINAFINQLGSNAYWEDASFIRCRNVTLSYLLPANWINKSGIQDCHIYFSGQNLFTLTPYKGLDPETKSNFAMPILRVLTFGIRTTL